jgi:cobaltochelatase CobT
VISAQARARRQERVEALCAASARALSAQPDLQFRGQRLHRGRKLLPFAAPHLFPLHGEAGFSAFRGAADAIALRLRHSDTPLHQRLWPADPVERMLFELLEQYRAESLVSPQMPGVRRNLRHAFEAWSLAFHHAGLTDTAHGLLLYTVAQMCRARVFGEAVLEDTEDLLEATRAGIGPLLGAALAGLRRARADQAAYAVHALDIARTVAELLRNSQAEAGASAAIGDSELQAAFALLMDSAVQSSTNFATAISGRSRLLAGAADAYRVFTRQYDRERRASDCVRAELLAEYREQLEQRIAGMGVNLHRLARTLQSLLAHPQPDGWDHAQEEGLIDGRRLSQLVASPTERRLFRNQPMAARADCVVTVLVDCSGSMRQHAPMLAALLDLWIRALEMAGVPSEVLGFTTASWSGGRAQRDWQRAGRPEHPGRLNELCHLVFKDADTRWRHARQGLAALLKPDLFREGVDGEAVLWAARRLAARDEARKILLVVSDGSPMDSATQLANDPHYLDHHLRDVARSIEQSGICELLGVGVALDLSPWYSRSHVLDLEAVSANGLLGELTALIARQVRR